MLSYRFDPFESLARQALRGPVSADYDAFKRGDEIVVQLDLPGIDPGSLEVNVDKDVVTLTATRSRITGDDVIVYASGRSHGEIRRSLRLGEDLDVSRLSADYTDGVVTLTVPVAEQSKPRKVEVSSGARTPQPVLEGQPA